MEPPTRITWLARPLFDWHPFIRNIFAPFMWTAILYITAVFPLLLSGQYSFAFSRPFYVCFVGILSELFLAYAVMLLYTHIFRDLPLAIQEWGSKETTDIIDGALVGLNSHKRLLLYTILPISFVLILLVTLSFFQVLDRDGYAFLYFLDQSWHKPGPGGIYRLFSLWLLVIFTSSILLTGFWFQYYHWRMFHSLLALRVYPSPILIYHGFSKLWLATNISSIAMLSCNLFLMALLDFKPHPFQLVVSLMVTMPGVLTILWPTYNLYRTLVVSKEARTDELLEAGQQLYGQLDVYEQSMAYATIYNSIFLERNVGNMQASISFSVAMVSLVIAVLQAAGLDLYLRTLFQT